MPIDPLSLPALRALRGRNTRCCSHTPEKTSPEQGVDERADAPRRARAPAAAGATSRGHIGTDTRNFIYELLLEGAAIGLFALAMPFAHV